MRKLIPAAIVSLLLLPLALSGQGVTTSGPSIPSRPASGHSAPDPFPRPPDFPFDSGITHAWKMEEATGATRRDSVGALNLLEVGNDVVRATGISGYSAQGVGDAYLQAEAPDSVGSAFTISVWIKVPFSGYSYAGAEWGDNLSFLLGDDGNVGLFLWDPVTGDDSGAGDDCGDPATGTWILLVGRVNQTAKTFNLRVYGCDIRGPVSYDGIEFSGPWVNSFDELVYTVHRDNMAAPIDGIADEMYVFSKYLSDLESDMLWTGFYRP